MSAPLETDSFEHFRVLRREDGSLWELGRGAMGVTFKAVDTRLDALVALKVIGEKVLANTAAHERFRREARAAASLRHSHVASVYHFGQEGTNYFYAMEFVEGESVAAFVKARGPLPWPVALDITRQAAGALAAVHARLLVHRDIKPDNLMLTCEAGGEPDTHHVKLIDFGLAKSLLPPEDAPTDALTVGFLGTPYYASPEQFEEMDCDIRCDIYSLGATLWFMLTGRPPFTGNLLQVFQQHVSKPPPVAALPASLPPEVRGLLTRMLAKRPGDRPQTPGELRREIDACRKTEAPSSPSVAEETLAEPVARIFSRDAGGESASSVAATTPAAASSSMPLPMTRFFGREKELATLCGFLRDGHRLVTITGAGGTGKTRLALEAASRVAPTLGRQTFFVPLSDLTDIRFLARRVRDTLLSTAPLEDADALDETRLLTSITAALAARPTLLLLDNFEQLAEDGAEFVGRLLARVDSLACMITSRRRLDLSGEREFSLSTLSVPPGGRAAVPLEKLGEFASVRLFLDRAQAVRADFALNEQNAGAVAELCRQLEGMPLAIELAAARAEVLTPQQMVKRLAESLNFLVGGKKDVAARHRTLRATLDWSYELLPPELRTFFARLSVFRGGWTSEAAAAVLEPGEDPDEALMRLSALRRYSLILAEERGDTMRYRMLETLRQYAGEQLARLGDEEAVAVRGQHRDFYLALSLRAEPELRKSDQAQWLDLLKTEHENFRAALAGTKDGDPAQLSLAYNLHRFWVVHGHLREGREWFARAFAGLAKGETGAPDPLVAKAHNAAGVLAWSAGDLEAAQAHLEQSLALFEALGDVAGTASALNNLGLAACERSDADTARARYEASIALYRRMGKPALLAAVLSNQGQLLLKQRLYPDARRNLEESLALETTSLDQYNRANILASLGEAEAHEGNLAGAYRRFEECLTIRLEIGDAENFELYWRMAGIAANHGDKAEAARLLGAAEAVRSALSLRLPTETAADFQTDHAAVSAGMGAAEFAAAWNEGKSMNSSEIIRLCQTKTS